MRRTEKTWHLFSIVIGAAISFLPGVIVVLMFDTKIPLTASVVLWFLSTAVLLEHWWWAEDVFRKFPNDSFSIMFVTFGYLMALLSLPAILLGARVDPLRALRYYGGTLVLLATFDIVFCITYAREIWRTHETERYEFIRCILIDATAIFVFALWLGYVLPSGSSILRKSLGLSAAYLLFVFSEFLINVSFGPPRPQIHA